MCMERVKRYEDTYVFVLLLRLFQYYFGTTRDEQVAKGNLCYVLCEGKEEADAEKQFVHPTCQMSS